MRLTKRERAERKRRRKEALDWYARTHSAEEFKRHVAVLKYPSGRWSHGGANRSANIKREVRVKTLTIALCNFCGGVSEEVAALTSLFPRCACQ